MDGHCGSCPQGSWRLWKLGYTMSSWGPLPREPVTYPKTLAPVVDVSPGLCLPHTFQFWGAPVTTCPAVSLVSLYAVC